MLWLALHLPLLSLEAFCATLAPDQRTRPAVLLHPHPQQHRVHRVNAAAAEQGIRPDSTRATALALVPGLCMADSNPARDAAALQAVVHTALAFTPSVTRLGGVGGSGGVGGVGGADHDRTGAASPPTSVHTSLHNNSPTVLMDVQASLRLFGGLPALCQRLRQALAPLGHHVQMAAAPTALGAALLAQWWPRRQTSQPPDPQKAQRAAAGVAAGVAVGVADRADDWAQGPHTTQLPALQALLGQAPVALLCPGATQAQALHSMGLHTLADLRALPRAGLARRLGQDLLTDLDRAFGLQPHPHQWLVLPTVFESQLELQARAENTDQVLHGASVLLARLVAWAQARQGRVRAFTLQMQHERQRQVLVPPTLLRIELAAPALDPAHLQLLLRERLAHTTLAAPTLELRLHCQHLVAASAPNAELFATQAGQAEGMVRLLERLCARLGPAQVQRLLPVADHRPERASRSVPAQDPLRPAAWAMLGDVTMGDMTPGDGLQGSASPSAWPAPAHRTPLPLHRPAWLLPEPLPLAERDALPLLQGHPLHLLSGPERIESGWWDDAPVARDYYIAMAQDQSLVWVYRGRLPNAAGEVNWYLQGRFA
jgi:protein ImuB